MLKVDLHIHSISSGHAYPTIYEILEYSKKKGMKIIALTDHGPSMTGAPNKIHFHMGNRKPKTPFKFLWGCELNIIDELGNVDLTEEDMMDLDFTIVGLHKFTPFLGYGEEQNTNAIINAMQYAQILAHPTNYAFEYDYKKVIEQALEKDIILELNLSYVKRKLEDQNELDKMKYMIEQVKAKGKRLIINSDAHFLHEIGDDSILKQANIIVPKDIVWNNYPKELLVRLGLNP